MAYTVIKTEQGANAGNGYYTEYLCESVDDIATLPTEVENGGPRPGSLALLEDGTVYLLKNNREWSEFSMAGGGGGGSTGGGVMSIRATVDGQSVTLDKTWQQIYDHIAAGGFAVTYLTTPEVGIAQTMPITLAEYSDDTYYVYAIQYASNGSVTANIFDTNSTDGYPFMAIGG